MLRLGLCAERFAGNRGQDRIVQLHRIRIKEFRLDPAAIFGMKKSDT